MILKKWESKIKRKGLNMKEKLIFLTSSGDMIYNGKINIDQTNLLKNWKELSKKSKPKTKNDRNKKNTFQSVIAPYEGR